MACNGTALILLFTFTNTSRSTSAASGIGAIIKWRKLPSVAELHKKWTHYLPEHGSEHENWTEGPTQCLGRAVTT
jgi:hypothetical protein